MRRVALFVVAGCSIFGADMKYGYLKNHTLTPKKWSFNIEVGYLLLNDSVDVLNLKDRELANTSLASLGAIGDMSGTELGGGYSASDDIYLSAKRVTQKIDYVVGELENKKDELFVRYHLFDEAGTILNSGASIDVGVIKNSASKVSTNSLEILNKFISKMPQLKDVQTAKVIQNSEPNEYFDSGYYFLYQKDKNSSPIDAKLNSDTLDLSISDLSDIGYYVKYLSGFHEMDYYVDFYAGYRKNRVKTFLDSTLFYDKNIASLYEDQYGESFDVLRNKRNLNRDESLIFGGFAINKAIDSVLIEMNYEFSKIFRKDIINEYDSNHALDLYVGYGFDEHWYLFVGGKIMSNQFNSELPYMYNSYSASQFDKMYGWSKIVLGYRF